MDRTSDHDEPSDADPAGVLQLRLVVGAADYEDAVRFYRDVLGLPEQAAFSGEGHARVVILDAGRATLEIANPAQKRMIDEVEVGRPVAPHLRVAFEVSDTATVTRKLTAAGATELAPPTVTPWGSVNSRLEGPAGLQLTLFQELEVLDERSSRAGFGFATHEDGASADEGENAQAATRRGMDDSRTPRTSSTTRIPTGDRLRDG